MEPGDSDTLLPLRSDTNIFTQNTYTYYIYSKNTYYHVDIRYVNLIETVVECVCARVCVCLCMCAGETLCNYLYAWAQLSALTFHVPQL